MFVLCFFQGEESPSAVSTAGDAGNQESEQNPEALKESIRLAEVCFAVTDTFNFNGSSKVTICLLSGVCASGK